MEEMEPLLSLVVNTIVVDVLDDTRSQGISNHDIDLAHNNLHAALWSSSHSLTVNMLNCFKDYKRYIYILNHILDLTWPK